METMQITDLRDYVRHTMSETPIYTHSIADLMAIIKADVPSIDLRDGALFALSLSLIMLSSECEQACIHKYARSMAALADRILIDQELEQQVS